MARADVDDDRSDTFDELMTPDEVADLLRVSVHSLARWRCEGGALPFLKLGAGRTSLIRYRRSEVLAYLDRATRRSTVDPGDEA